MSERDVLLDTAPLVALFNARDQWHARTATLWPDLVGRCVTTEAIVAEASHLVLRATGNAFAPLEFLLAAGIPIEPLNSAGHRRAVRLMQQYQDLPMDYGDATLVVLAEALGIGDVFTTDRRGFTAYRAPRAARFRIFPNA